MKLTVLCKKKGQTFSFPDVDKRIGCNDQNPYSFIIDEDDPLFERLQAMSRWNIDFGEPEKIDMHPNSPHFVQFYKYKQAIQKQEIKSLKDDNESLKESGGKQELSRMKKAELEKMFNKIVKEGFKPTNPDPSTRPEIIAEIEKYQYEREL